MNKFRNNLHSAFFFPGSNGNGEFYKHFEDAPESENKPSEEEVRQEEVEQKQAAEAAADERDETLENSRQAVSEVVDDAIKAQSTMEHVDNVFGYGYSSQVLNEIYKRKNDWTLDREKVKQIQWRIGENIKLWNVWEKNIQEWYKHLLKTLLDNKYFHNPFHKTEEEIRRMYIREVESQYEKYVWDIDDKGFEQVKKKLFSKNTANYPANIVYKKLNKTEIFDSELWDWESHVVEANNVDNFESNLSEAKTQNWEYKKEFLTEYLPNYLWDTKDSNWFERNALPYFPILSKSFDKKSWIDKKNLKDFLSVVERISVDWGGKPELALLDVFKDAKANWTDYQWKEGLASKNIRVPRERDMKKLIEAGRFYLTTQRVDLPVEEQRNLYLSILGIIERAWGIDNAIAKFTNDVKDYKENKEGKEKADNEESAKALKAAPDGSVLYNITNKFSKNFTSALNLANMDPDSFTGKSAIDILADFNNDGSLTYTDSGATKTWLQFKRIAEVAGDTAINNLLEQAKAMNKTMDLGLTDDDLKYKEIEKWNKKLILLLQNIISQPWWDLAPLLMFGPDSAKKYKEAFDRLPKWPEDAKVQAAAKELLKDIKLEDLQKIEWLDISSTGRAWVEKAVAWKLFTEYTRWIWLWWTLSFDQWIKGVSLNGWFQVSKSWVTFGLTLWYNHKFNLWNWRSVRPWVSFWYVPLFSTSVWWSVEVAKEWISKKSVAHQIWLKWWFTEVFGISDVISVWLWRDSDKLAWIEWDRSRIESEFNEKIMSPLIDSIWNELWEKKILDLEDGDVLSKVKQAIDKQVDKVFDKMPDSKEKTKLKQSGKESLIDNTIRFLSFFDKADLSNEAVREAIANKMAEQYSYAREDEHLNAIDEESYVSGFNIRAAYVRLATVWVPVFGLWFNVKTHEKDTYWDRSYWRFSMRWREVSGWNGARDKELLNKVLNDRLPEGKKLDINSDGFIVVPQTLFRNVYINPGMKQLMKKDESGNVLLHPESYIDPLFVERSSTESIRISVGWPSKNAVKLSEVDEDWFTSGDIDPSKLTGKENIFTKKILAQKLDELKDNYPTDQDLQKYEFDDSIVSKMERGKKYRIILTKNWQWISTEVEETTEWKGLTIEYNPLDKKALVSKEATIIANNTYAEALKVTSNALYNISHDKNNKLNSEYRTFANAVKNQEYEDAKATILAMLPKMDKYISQYQQKNNKVDFSEVSEILKNLEWAELGKALMSINNVFARVSSVHGWTDWLYHFKMYDSTNERLLDRDMWSIVEARWKEISWKIDRSDLDEDVKKAYKDLIAFAESYRKNNPDKFSGTKKEAQTLENAIWINLWNAINVENPLFNPEVYADSVIDLKDLDFEWVDVLKRRTLNVVAWNKALMSPILDSLGFDENASINLENAKYENWQLSLDINGKNVILKADMKIALFAQCVNLMLVLDNISAEIPWEPGKVEFGPYVRWNGAIIESTKKDIYTSSKTSVEVAFSIREQQEEQQEKKPDYEDWSNPSNGKPGGEDKTQPETDWKPIWETWGETWGNTTGGDNIWTEWGQNGWGSIDHGNDWDL